MNGGNLCSRPLTADKRMIITLLVKDVVALSSLELPVSVAPFEVCVAASEPGRQFSPIGWHQKMPTIASGSLDKLLVSFDVVPVRHRTVPETGILSPCHSARADGC